MGKPRSANPPAKNRGQALQSIRRIAGIDALRGVALLIMIAYHFGFDLNHLGWIHYDINYDPRWLLARTLILGSFLLIVGTSLALAETQPKNLQQKARRIGKIVVAAAMVTAGSWVFLPEFTIYFGTLHAIALMSLILSLRPWRTWVAGSVGLLLIALGLGYVHPAFDSPGLAWLGLMTHKPQTADYVPMLPWFGVCLIGYAVAKAAFQSKRGFDLGNNLHWPPLLVWLGRHSLAIYLLHQSLLLGVMIPATSLLKPS